MYIHVSNVDVDILVGIALYRLCLNLDDPLSLPLCRPPQWMTSKQLIDYRNNTRCNTLSPRQSNLFFLSNIFYNTVPIIHFYEIVAERSCLGLSISRIPFPTGICLNLHIFLHSYSRVILKRTPAETDTCLLLSALVYIWNNLPCPPLHTFSLGSPLWMAPYCCWLMLVIRYQCYV